MLDPEACSLADAATAFATGTVSVAEATEHMLERIARANAEIGALTDVLAASARREARQADSGFTGAADTEQAALAGMPLAIKDIIDTTPARCSAGLAFLHDYRPQEDAEIVRRLRAAGAVIMGVAATDAGACGVRTLAVRHPQAPRHIVGGSSGGAAAAVAAGFALGSIGTDTGGSVRIPAACCSLVGFKPTYGRISTAGIRPFAASLDHVGAIARRVPDVIAIHEVLDPQLVMPAPRQVPSTLNIGHDPDYYASATLAVKKAMSALLERLAAAGHRLVEVTLPSPDDALQSQWTIGTDEAAAYYFREFPSQLESCPQIIQEMLALARTQCGYEYVQAKWDQAARQARVDQLYRQVDVILTPTLPMPTPLRETTEITLAGAPCTIDDALLRYTCLFNETGHPALSMPVTARDAEGLSISLQLVGKRGGDGGLLAIAAAMEQMLDLKFEYPLI